MPSLSIQGDAGVEEVALEAEAVTIGRSLESDVRIKDIKASRRHCQIVRTPDGYRIVDLGSGNGTFVNGVRVKEQKLNPGDSIQIGQTVITFADSAPAEEAPPASESPAPAEAPGPVKPPDLREIPKTEMVDPAPPAPPEKKETRARMEAPVSSPHKGTGRQTGHGSTRGAARTGHGPAPAPSKKSPLLIGIIVVAVLGAAGLAYMASTGNKNSSAGEFDRKAEAIHKRFLEKDPKQYGGAVDGWREWANALKEKGRKAKVEEQIKAINDQATVEWKSIAAKSGTMPAAGAVKYLESEQFRFEGCDCEKEIRKRIDELKKTVTPENDKKDDKRY